jgi:glycosyltransferase involved in cell wall biosynthesis
VNYLLIVPSLRRAGAETQAVDLANGLSANGHDVSLFCFEAELDQRDRLLPEVKFFRDQRRRKYDFAFVKSLAAILDREGIEIVHGVMQFSSLVGWLAIQQSRSKPLLISAIHTTENRGLKEELHDRCVFRWILARSSAVVFVCEYQRAYWMHKYPGLKQHSWVVYNGVDSKKYDPDPWRSDTHQLRQQFKIGEGDFVFSCIAAFRPEKGHHILIEAFEPLANEALLMLAGEGQLRPTIEQLVRQKGIGDRVRFLGNIADVRPLLAVTDSTVLASTAVETFSIAMLESMAMGVPMIAPKIGGLQEAIIDGETGLVFEIGDKSELASKMRYLTENRVEAQSMGGAGREKVGIRFTIESMVKETEELCVKLLDQL